jgi:hypothetical protein
MTFFEDENEQEYSTLERDGHSETYLILLCHCKRRLACFLSNRGETAKALAVRATVKYPNEPNLQVAAA